MRLTERSIKRIAKPTEGYTLTWDDQLKGVGLRTTANGMLLDLIEQIAAEQQPTDPTG